MNYFQCPKWTKYTRPTIALLLLIGLLCTAALVYFGGLPRMTDIGYQPKQPVSYSHALHAGELGVDCRYCHNTVERTAPASLPPNQTCMNCHTTIRTDSPKLTLIRESSTMGTPIEWVRVHDLPDYVYFNHSAHAAHGVGCVSCHGRIDKKERVSQVNTLRMSWCLDCHRNPEKNLRPLDAVAQMDWQPNNDPKDAGLELQKKYSINPSTDCSTCHR